MFKLSKLYDRTINLYAQTKIGFNRPSLASSYISIKKYEPMYSLVPSKNSVNEGAGIRFDINGVNVKNGSTLYYNITGCSASDFVDSSLTGTCVISGGTGYFTKTLVTDLTTEGAEQFVVELRTSVNGRVIKYSTPIEIADTSLTPVPVYAVTATPDSTNEAGTVGFNWSVVNSVGAALTWEITGVVVGDFTDGLGLSGSLSGTSGTVTKVLSQDQLTEGLETISFNFKAAGVTVATCTCAITDSSLTPFYSLSSNPTSTNESGTVVFSYSSSNVPVGTVLDWSMTGVQVADFTDGLGLSGNLTINSSGTITKVLAADLLTEGAETITIHLNANGSSKVSATCTVVDSSALTYVDDVFSTYLYTGNGSTQTINNGIDLAGKGGLIWTKNRVSAVADFNDNFLAYGTSGSTAQISNKTTGARSTTIKTFNSNGFTIDSTYGNGTLINSNGDAYVSWTFRKAPKFFDIVTWTGEGTISKTINHNLGAVPAFIIIKCTSATDEWMVYHQSIGNAYFLKLHTTDVKAMWLSAWNNTTPTISTFTVGSADAVNRVGHSYVAYLFAHDPSTEGLIQCGSFYHDNDTAVNLGWEPQFLLVKKADGTGDWFIIDTTREWIWASDYLLTKAAILKANTSAAETSAVGDPWLSPTQTGFKIPGFGGGGGQYIYLAIRRSNKPPADATKVFKTIARTGTGAAATVTGVGFAPDLLITGDRNTARGHGWCDRLRGTKTTLRSWDTGADTSDAAGVLSYDMDGVSLGIGGTFGGNFNESAETYINHFFKRAKGFFDVVCVTTTPGSLIFKHSLGVTPQLVIVKNRTAATAKNWKVSYFVGTPPIIPNKTLFLNSSSPSAWEAGWCDYLPSINEFRISSGNDFTTTAVVYLFASLPGISKVGSYTGNGSSQSVNCSFTNGSRFLLVKRTDSTGDWYIWNLATGIGAGNDPHMSLNTEIAEVTSDNSVDYSASGFIVNQVAATNINVSGGTYIYLAIA